MLRVFYPVRYLASWFLTPELTMHSISNMPTSLRDDMLLQKWSRMNKQLTLIAS